MTEVGNGDYSVAASAIDANTLGPISLYATASGCDPTNETFIVVDYNPNSFVANTQLTGPNAVTGLDLTNDAFEIALVKNPSQAMPAKDSAIALRQLNAIIGQWSIMSLTIPVIGREVFTLTAGRGTPTDPYTIGPSGDFDTSRPSSIISAAVQVSSAPNPFEIPLGIYTDDAYNAIVVKTLSSTYPQGLYYNATFDSGWGSIYLYPIPSQANDLVLYRAMQLSQFGSLSSSYNLPPGAQDALTYELAKRLAQRYGRPVDPLVLQMADQFMAIYQRGNTKMADLGMDAALTGSVGLYNIESDAFNGFGR